MARAGGGDAFPLESRPVPALAPTQTDIGVVSLTLPSTVGAAGTYYLFAVADADARIPEPDETNNVRAARIMIGPDLVVDSVVAPSSAVAGGTIVVSDTTRNRGVGPAAATRTSFYLSTSTALTPWATPLGSRAVPPLGPLASSTGTTTLTLPSWVGEAGTYYVIAVADGGTASPEADEANNTRVARIVIGPDLVIDAVTAPVSAAAGETVFVTDMVRNRGISPAAASTLRFYLSPRKSPDDFLAVALGSRDVPPLAAGQTSTGMTALTIPADTPAGTRYLIVLLTRMARFPR